VLEAGIPFGTLRLYVRAQVLDVDATEPADLDVGQSLAHQHVHRAALNPQPPAGFLNRKQACGVTLGGHGHAGFLAPLAMVNPVDGRV
jgi:hypothetical protein